MMGSSGEARAEDPRVTRSKRAVIETVRAILQESGFAGVTIEAVALASGVAKTTIYRHWPDCNSMMLDAFTFDAQDQSVASTGDLRSDLTAALVDLAVGLREGEWARLAPALIEASERDTEFRALTKPFLDSRRKPLRDRIRRAIRAGELSSDTDTELLVALLVGPLFYRRLITHQPVTDAVAHQIVARVLREL